MNRLLLPIWIAVACWMGISHEAKGQSSFSYRLRYLTTEEGLSQNTVDDILRDSHGFMWFATWNGLCRYDGYDMQVFKATGQRPGLPDNFVQSICEDQQGHIWIGTAAGLGLYNLAQARFEPISWAGDLLARANIEAIAVDAHGKVWVGTVGEGLFCIQPAKNDFAVRHYPLPNNIIHDILPLDNGGCLLGTRNGIYTVSRAGSTIQWAEDWVLPELELRAVRCLWQDDDESLWAGTDFGLFHFQGPGQAPTAHYHNPDQPHVLVHNTVTALARDREGRLLVGTLGGVCIYQGHAAFLPLSGDPGTQSQLNNEFVNSLLCDTYGNVWIGTEKGGVNTYNLFQKKFHQLTHQPGNPQSLNHKTVNSILAEPEYLWVGTAGGGLNRVSQATGQIQSAQYDVHLPQSLSSDFITVIHRDQQDQLWVATWGGGLNRMLDEEMTAFARYQTTNTNLSSNFISSIWEDENGFLLIGTMEGVMAFDPDEEEFVEVSLGQLPGKEPARVGCILKDRSGRYWIGTRRGLYTFDGQGLALGSQVLHPKNLRVFHAMPQQPRGLEGDYVISLHQDRQGRIWVGTFGSGLMQVQIEEGEVVGFESFTQADGLCNNTVYSMQEDSAGHLWLSTDHGLARFDPERGSFKNYFESDGLADNQFYWSASCQDRAGRLYFGSVGGLSYFYPQDIQPYPFTPEVVLSDFRVFNRSLGVQEERHGAIGLRQAISLADSTILSYQDNVFSIEFTAPTYHRPERLTYLYQMEGVDQNWVEVPADRHFTSYTNLSGGTYRFRVKARNEDGTTSQQVASLTVMIEPPFWQTPWFTGLLVLLGVIAVMTYIRLRTHYLHQQKRKLEQKVQERTQKIEEQKATLEQQKGNLLELNEKVKMVNQLRLRFFTNISHEFRTPLTLIIDPIESLLERHGPDTETGRTLRMMHRNGQRLLHIINQLMNFRRLEAGKLKVRAGQADVAGFVEEVYTSFAELAKQRHVDYQYLRDGQPQGATWFDAEKVENVLYNLLANAFKYTPKGGQIRLRLRFLPDPELGHRLMIEVSDNGVGIQPEQQAHIFNHFYQVENAENRHLHGSGVGLALTKELITAMHGQIEVHSTPGQGSTFRVTLPYRAEDFTRKERETEPIAYHSNLSTQVKLTRDELSAPAIEPTPPSEQPRRDQPLILIAEDNHDLRAFLSQSLGNQYRILETDNGKEALELARKHTPQLIVSDIMMPVMDGLELCSHLKGHVQTSHIPVILLTARHMVEQWVEGLETGADDYIPKPFNLKILQARIDNLITSRHQLKLVFTKEERPAAQEVTENPVDQAFLQQVYDRLDERYSDTEFTHDQLADDLCISRSLLYKKLKALTGMTVTEFINAHRLRQASRMLNQEDLNISEVAFRCGFSDPKYFSRIFRKYYGMSPSKYAQTQLESA